MHKQHIIDSIINNLNPEQCIIKNISLTAGENTLRKRLYTDISAKRRTADIIEKSIARIPMYFELDTVKIDTENKSVQEIADEIKAL